MKTSPFTPMGEAEIAKINSLRSQMDIAMEDLCNYIAKSIDDVMIELFMSGDLDG